MKTDGSSKSGGDRETVERLLDAAERLFGEFGYDGVGLRGLAEEAKVNLGAATYHFGSKEALYIETFMRRFRSANAERLRLLREAETKAAERPVAVETIVECLLIPAYELGTGHANFRLFLARNLFMPPPFLYAAIHKELASTIERFTVAFRRALPKVPENLIHLRTMFAMGALLQFTVQAARLSAPHLSKFDPHLLRELVRFVSAGMQSAPAVPSHSLPLIPIFPKPFYH
jgi:AcrR family transcriptional regulator